ncbi:hypothetical protein [Dactylosporangium sp. NPDC051541]|uniref:hypothetical protein n=1 Tax=Dactylosporangium sp. NPDC051541 TaxID=3363977 RepID=UPI003799D913
MMDRLDERIGNTLEQRAATLVEAPGFTAEDIVRQGRRAVRRRAAARLGLTAAGVAALVAVIPVLRPGAPPVVTPYEQPATSPAAPVAGPPASCAVERLSVGGGKSMVMAMDPAGRFIAGRSEHDGAPARFDLLLWHDGALSIADLPGRHPVPADVNAAGVVVGTDLTGGGDTGVDTAGADGTAQAWIFRDGRVTQLPGTRFTEARAVSDDGVVAGTDDERPVLWRDTTRTPMILPPPPGGKEGRADDISPDGRTVVGTVRTPGNRAYVWVGDAPPRELPRPVVGGTEAVGWSAVAINGDWVLGAAEVATGSVPVRWNLRTGEVLVFPDARIPGLQLSAGGWLPATTARGAGTLLLNGQESVPLPRLPGPGAAVDVPKAISDDGRLITGDASQTVGTVPAVWKCR